MKTILRKKKKRNNSSSSCRPKQSLTTGCNKWPITSLGTASRKEHKYSSFCRSSKRWTTELFFHLLDVTVLNSSILLSSCGAKYTHRDFRLLLVSNFIEEAGKSQDRPTPRLVVRPSVGAKNVLLLDSRHNKHWRAKSSTQMYCCLCASHDQRKGMVYKCTRCDVGQFNVPCFVEYHTEVNLLNTLFVNTVCCDKTGIQDATDLLQQPELCE